MLLRALRLFFPSGKDRKMAHWQRFVHKPQTTNQKTEILQRNKDERENTTMSAKGIKLLNPSESNWTNNYWALSKAFATMTHQIAHRVTHGLFCKMRNIRSPYLASCGIVLSERNERAKVYPWCTHCTTTKVHILHNNCLKMQSGRAARKKGQKIFLSREKILLIWFLQVFLLQLGWQLTWQIDDF